MNANSYRTNEEIGMQLVLLAKADGVLAIPGLQGSMLDAAQRLLALSNGPKEQLKIPSNGEILLAAGEMKPNELAAVKAVLRWYVSKHNATKEQG